MNPKLKIYIPHKNDFEEENIIAGFFIIESRIDPREDGTLYLITDNERNMGAPTAYNIHNGGKYSKDGYVVWDGLLKSTNKCLEAKEGDFFKGKHKKKCYRLTREEINKTIKDCCFVKASSIYPPDYGDKLRKIFISNGDLTHSLIRD